MIGDGNAARSASRLIVAPLGVITPAASARLPMRTVALDFLWVALVWLCRPVLLTPSILNSATISPAPPAPDCCFTEALIPDKVIGVGAAPALIACNPSEGIVMAASSWNTPGLSGPATC